MGCPITQLVGFTIRPHYRYLSPTIIFKIVPLYPRISRHHSHTGRLYSVPRVMSPSQFHYMPYLILEDDAIR